MDFQVQGKENQWLGSNRASFAWLQYKPRRPSKGMSLDPRKEICLTSVFPWSEEQFDCTIRYKKWWNSNWNNVSSVLFLKKNFGSKTFHVPFWRDWPKLRWQNMCLKDLNPKWVHQGEELLGLSLIVLQLPTFGIHFEIMFQLDVPKQVIMLDQQEPVWLEQF